VDHKGARRKTPGPAWRRRGPLALVAILCASVVAGVATGAAQPLTGLQFLPPGHWVYNVALQAAFHIDGASTSVDAQAPVPGDPGSQVVQGDTSGYVVGRSKITEFGKSSLSVEQTVSPPVDEVPLGIEAAGGPYLVYRAAGKVVRLGDPSVTVATGGAVGDPVVTADGTMWLFRTGAGLVCELPKGADRVSSCPAVVPPGHSGALTVVGGQPEFLDTSAGQLHRVDAGGLGPGVPLGVAVSPGSRPAATDVAGRVAILDPANKHMQLVDPGSPVVKPVTVVLPDGDYDGPVSTGSAVALVDRQDNTLLTYGADGKQADAKPIPRESGAARLTSGEDNRVYVEGPDGTHVLVVDHDGKVTDVPVVGQQPGTKPVIPADPGVPPPVAPPIQQADQPDTHGSGTTHDPGTTAGAGNAAKPDKPATPKKKPDPPAVPASPPGAPASVSASAGNGSASVSWGAAADNRGPITSYSVSWQGSGGQSGSTSVGGDSRHATVSGLANGTRYTMTVTATNKAGTGPGASASPVTPVSAASAPTGLTAKYSAGSATVSWGEPALGGGTLAHYLVSASGLGQKTVTGTSTTYSGLAAGSSVTFSVRAVTTTPGGQTLTGATASKTLAVPSPKLTITRGAATSSSSCKAPDCAWINVKMTGFAPNTTYKIVATASQWGDFSEPCTATTDANGSATCNDTRFDGGGQTVWVDVTTPDGKIESNHLTWTAK
jgi:hypothetical protein